MTVSTKLYGVVGALALTGLLVAGSGIWYLKALGRELTTATDKTAVKLDLVNASRARTWEMVSILHSTYVSASVKDSKSLEAGARRWQSVFKRAGEQIVELRPLMESERSRVDLTRYETGLVEFGRMSAEYIGYCREQKLPEALGLMPKVQAFSTLADESLTDLKNRQRDLLKVSQGRAAILQAQSMFVNLLTGCALVLGVVLAVFVVRSIHRTLTSAVRELSEGAAQVAEAASQVSGSSQSLAQGSSEQAASLEQTSASTEEIQSMVRKCTENSGAATSLVMHCEAQFSEANCSLDEMVVAMGEINASSGRISKIIKVIDDIAFQTNILALNAAVEAARAGEAGLGFAVVADEVRNLAQRCAQAAKDTADLIEESIGKSTEGKGKVDQVAGAIRGISEESARIKALVEEVNVGSQEQSRGIEQIGKAILQMEQVTQTTAANAEEGAAAAEELNAQSEALKDVVRQLTALLGGVNPANGDPLSAKPRHLEVRPRLLAPHPHGKVTPTPTARVAAAGTKKTDDVFPMGDAFIEM